jgi:hypothetical protein
MLNMYANKLNTKNSLYCKQVLEDNMQISVYVKE